MLLLLIHCSSLRGFSASHCIPGRGTAASPRATVVQNAVLPPLSPEVAELKEELLELIDEEVPEGSRGVGVGPGAVRAAEVQPGAD